MIILEIVFFVLHLLNIFCNSFLLYALWKLKKLKARSFQFIAILCVSDVLHGIFGFTDQVILAMRLRLSKDAYFVIGAGIFYFLNFSTSMVLIIAIDRFIHMRYLNAYARVMTKCKATCLVLANVLFTLLTLITTNVLLTYQRQTLLANRITYIHYRIILGFLYLSLIVFIVIVYWWTYKSIQKQTKNMILSKKVMCQKEKSENRREGCRPREEGRHMHRNSSTEFAKGMALVLGCLLLFVFPNLCLTPCEWLLVLHADRETLNRAFKVMWQIGSYFYMASVLNCSFNAVILIYFSSELNKFTKKFFRCGGRSEKTTSAPTFEESRLDRSLALTKSDEESACSVSKV